jgi:hypothetical protein
LNGKILLVSLPLLSLLLLSGAIYQAGGSSLLTSSAQNSNNDQSINVVASGQASSFGELKKIGSTYVSPNQPPVSTPVKTSGDATRTAPARVKPTGTALALTQAPVPVVSADSIVNSAGGVTTAKGLNALDNYEINGVDYEPPDQGLCAGNGYVIDVVNTVMRVYTTSFASYSSDISPNTIEGLPLAAFTSDPRCLYDQATAHWFITQLFINFNSPGQGYEYISVSTTSVPWGTWNNYALNVTDSFPKGASYAGQTNDPGCPCFGDQPLLGASRDALVVSTNEFAIFGPAFNGAQLYLLDKVGLALGYNYVSFVHINALSLATPDGKCLASGGVFCWYSVNPAGSPTSSQYDNSKGGTEYALSSLDFQGTGDDRIATWAFSNLQSLHSFAPAVHYSVSVMTGLERYLDPVGATGNAFLAPQKPGPIPAGIVVFSNNPGGPIYGCKATCPEGLIQSNGDGMFDDVVYAQGALWGAVDTEVRQSSDSKTIYAGAAYWVIDAQDSSFSLASQGYVSASGEDVVFPSIGVGPQGEGVIAFSLTGANYYPSSAYGWISKWSNGLIHQKMFVADMGASPYDATTEYQCIAGTCTPASGLSYTPRFGDYSWAVWSDGRVYFATEYIQHKNCAVSQYKIDPSCGDTRGPDANWGTSLNSLPT